MTTCPRCGKETDMPFHTCMKTPTPRTDALMAKYVGRKKIMEHALQLEQELNVAKLKAADRNEWQEVAMKVSAERDTLKRERDEWKASHDNQVNLRRALMDRPDLKERAELVMKLQRERDEARSGSNVQCNTAWLETLERSNCYLTTDGRIVQRNDELDQLRKELELLAHTHQRADQLAVARGIELMNVRKENTQLRKVVDKFATACEAVDVRGPDETKIRDALKSHSKLPHVKQKETK